MKLGRILKTAGKRLLREVPGIDAVLDIVEDLTGEDIDRDKETASDLMGRIQNLPPTVQAHVLNLETETVKQQGETLRTMLLAEKSSTHTTRPKIAWGAFVVVATVTLVISLTWAFSVIAGKIDMTETIMDGWPFIVGLLAPFVTWLNNYFGMLKAEHQNRLDAAQGFGTRRTGVAGLIDAFKGR